MPGPVLGIDLGTTNSVVAYADEHRVRVLRDEDGQLITPSAVSFDPNGRMLVGHEARERRLVDARNTIFSVKRLLGRPFRSPEVQRAAEKLPFALEEGTTGGVAVRVKVTDAVEVRPIASENNSAFSVREHCIRVPSAITIRIAFTVEPNGP